MPKLSSDRTKIDSVRKTCRTLRTESKFRGPNYLTTGSGDKNPPRRRKSNRYRTLWWWMMSTGGAPERNGGIQFPRRKKSFSIAIFETFQKQHRTREPCVPTTKRNDPTEDPSSDRTHAVQPRKEIATFQRESAMEPYLRNGIVFSSSFVDTESDPYDSSEIETVRLESLNAILSRCWCNFVARRNSHFECFFFRCDWWLAEVGLATVGCSTWITVAWCTVLTSIWGLPAD
jgi:hypothetical protein